jgi:hypothetical protein
MAEELTLAGIRPPLENLLRWNSSPGQIAGVDSGSRDAITPIATLPHQARHSVSKTIKLSNS